MNAYVFLAEGFEEIEAVTIIDVLRRGGLAVKVVAVGHGRAVTGAHGITVTADILIAEAKEADLMILPGGMPGTTNLGASEHLKAIFTQHAATDKRYAAICAAPMVLGQWGLLKGKKATCYPGCESNLTGATVVNESVVIDGDCITSRGVGTALEFALKLVELTMGSQKSQQLKDDLLVK